MWVNFVWKAFIFSVLWARWEEGGFCYFDEGENWKWMFWLALTSLLLFGLHNNKAIGKKIVLAFQFFFVKLWENLCQAFWKGLCSFFSFVQKEAGPLSSFCCVSIRFDEKWSVNKWSLNIHILIDDALVHTTVSKRFSHSSHHSNGTPLGWVKNTLLSPIFNAALMVVPMGTQSTHTKFGAPRPHQFFVAGPQSFTT